ncbi:MAG: carboxypeptidase-like regulatory domain-containing protein, partial [Ichthyobacteriaceae bacterium]|nr:carboxypeptidase-like regulatory domain-containing protein [Ichthyobacteriaceae bacterium]
MPAKLIGFMKKQLLTLLLSLFITPLLFAQTEVSGVVTDGSNNEPFAFANVYVKNTTVGTTTDMDG